MRGFIWVMAFLAVAFFVAAVMVEPEKAALPGKPPTKPGDHYGSPAFRGNDVSRANDDDAAICDGTSNGDKAAVFYRVSNGDVYGGRDTNGTNRGCSHYGVPHRLMWHVTCEDINEVFFSESSRCGPTSFHVASEMGRHRGF